MKIFNWLLIGSILFLSYLGIKSALIGDIAMLNTALIGIFFNSWVFDRINRGNNDGV